MSCLKSPLANSSAFCVRSSPLTHASLRASDDCEIKRFEYLEHSFSHFIYFFVVLISFPISLCLALTSSHARSLSCVPSSCDLGTIYAMHYQHTPSGHHTPPNGSVVVSFSLSFFSATPSRLASSLNCTMCHCHNHTVFIKKETRREIKMMHENT